MRIRNREKDSHGKWAIHGYYPQENFGWRTYGVISETLQKYQGQINQKPGALNIQ
jgi:hypothetical protein